MVNDYLAQALRNREEVGNSLVSFYDPRSFVDDYQGCVPARYAGQGDIFRGWDVRGSRGLVGFSPACRRTEGCPRGSALLLSLRRSRRSPVPHQAPSVLLFVRADSDFVALQACAVRPVSQGHHSHRHPAGEHLVHDFLPGGHDPRNRVDRKESRRVQHDRCGAIARASRRASRTVFQRRGPDRIAPGRSSPDWQRTG